jgi:hypothetical protein
MSGGPDALVERAGETVAHEYATEYELDANGQVAPDSVETTTEEIQAVVSEPSETDEQRLEGRLSAGSIKLTVSSGVDVQRDRGGERDKIHRDGRVYEVEEVRDDSHPMTGTRKQTVIANELGGRPGG